MPQKNTVTILAPDGTPGDIPAENVPQALAAGGKIGVHVYDPNGNPGYVAHDVLGDALKAGATYAPPSKSTPAYQQQPQGFAQNLVAPIPQMAAGLYHNLVDSPRTPEEAAIKGAPTGDTSIGGRLMGALGQIGLGGYRTLIAPTVDAARRGDLVGSIPIAGPIAEAGANRIAQGMQGDVSGAIGGGIGDILAGGIAGRLIGGPGPAPAGALSPTERAAINVSKYIQPETAGAAPLTEALSKQGINVIDYARRNKIPITDARDLGKVAGLAADETYAPYNQMLDETGHNIVQTPNGSMSLKDIDTRINDISGDLRSGFRKGPAGQQVALGGEDVRLLRGESSNLADILHQSLGDLNNIQPQDVADIRQRGGQLRTIQNEVNSAATNLTGRSGAREMGSGAGLPMSKVALLDRLTSMIPGQSLESISGRKLVGALRGLESTGEPTTPASPLPANYPPSAADAVNVRAQQAMANQEFLRQHQLEQGAQDAAQQRVSDIASYRGANARTNQAGALQEFLHSNNLEQAAQDAAQGRGQFADSLRTMAANKTLQDQMNQKASSYQAGARLRQKGYENRR